jgi:hypothetical protein
MCESPPPPAGWTCGAAKYADGGSCDCNCGVEDPDCLALFPVTGCSAGQFCGDKDGICVGETGGETCANATVIAGTGAYFGSLSGKSNDLDPTDAGCTSFNEDGPDAVYAIQLDAGQQLTATAFQADADVAIYLLPSSCDASACLAGADEGAFGDPDTITFTATTAGTYYIVIDSFEDDASDYSLSVDVH